MSWAVGTSFGSARPAEPPALSPTPVTEHRRRWIRTAVAIVLATVLALAHAVPAGAQTEQWQDRLTDDFSALLSRNDTPADTCMSVSVDGVPLVEHRHTEMMVPASLMKLATVTAALELMGADHRFETRVVVDAGDLAAVRGGVLRGDVHLVGGGDPVLATKGYMRRLWGERPFTDADRLAASVKAALTEHGVRIVDGAIVGDGSRYPDNERDYVSHTVDRPAEGADDSVWKPSYRYTNLAGPLGGLTLNDGYLRHRSERQAHTRSSDPAQGAASVFDDLLEARGLVIRHRPRSGVAPGGTRRVELASISSPALGTIIERTGSYSENTAAEMLLKEIGYRTTGSARAQAVIGAAAVLSKALGPVSDEIEMVDGSGLSVHNQMSCRAAVALLERAQRDGPLLEGLSVAGKTGSLIRCSPSWGGAGGDEANPVRSKSGGLNDVMAVAGRVDARSRHELSFAVISNAPNLILRNSCAALRRIPITAAARFTYAPIRPAFADMTPGPADDVAASVTDAGLMSACDAHGERFCPDDTVSRAEFAATLTAAADLAAPAGLRGAVDSAGHRHGDAIDAALAAGVMSYCDAVSRRFCPDMAISKMEAAGGVLLAATRRHNGPIGTESVAAACAAGRSLRCNPATRLDLAYFLHTAFDVSD